MKNIVIRFSCFILFILSFFFFTRMVFAGEKIENFQVEARINKDSSVDVIEIIEYNFIDEYKHGIFRTIPLGFVAKGQLGHTEISVKSVTDELGNPYRYSITSKDPVNIKIGDPEIEITGKHIYKIEYELNRSIGHFDNYDEWYWNLTGNYWPTEILKVSAKIFLPTFVRKENLLWKDYCGIKGEAISCGNFEFSDTGEISYSSNNSEPFNVGSGVTIAVGFPKGLVSSPTKIDIFFFWLSRVWFIPIPFILFYFWFRKKIKYLLKRRAFFRKNTIAVEYDAGIFNPLEVGLLVNKKINDKDISAVIVNLTVMGYIKIENKDGEFIFKKIKDASPDMTLSEKTILETIANIKESDFGEKEAHKFLEAKSTSDTRLLARDYIIAKTKKIRRNALYSGNLLPAYIILPLFLAVNPGIFFWLIFGVWAGATVSGTFILIAIGNYIFKNALLSLTEKGFEAERLLLGLKLYLEVAEKDRINFANAPAKTPELFEKLLPFAMVLGLEKKWSFEFKDIYKTNPDWYDSGVSGVAFSPIVFLSTINSVDSLTSKAIVSSIGSSSNSSWSSSSGGSSGGGSSGGGGGGGGGGSW